MRKFALLLVILAVLVILAGCQVTPPPLSLRPTRTPAPLLKGSPLCAQLDEERMVQANESGRIFMPNQFVVTGPAGQIPGLLERVGALTQVQLQQVGEAVDLSYLGQVELPPETTLRFLRSPRSRAALESRLYQVSGETPVQRVICEINEAGKVLDVAADPNYITGPVPFSIGGSPFSIGGSPAGGPSAPADPALFSQQWAFQMLEVGDFRDPALAQTGAGVLVAIFDTSPFEDIPDGNWNAVRSYQGVPFRVSHPNPAPPDTPGTQGYADVRDHGLFAAGLVHAVAPESELHLIRVLNEKGRGDLFTLSQALNQFVQQTLVERGGSLGGTVLNLSLGVVHPEDLAAAGLASNEQAVEALLTPLQVARALGAVVVAAAGNGSNGSQVVAAEYPAGYPEVIGVAGVKPGQQRSCFSNAGDVAAPAGDGGDACTPAVVLDCSGDCPNALVSWTSLSPTGFSYWAGTSFATPLVSGEAALRLEKDKAATGSWPPPAQVETAIYASSQQSDPPDGCLGYGVVDPLAAMSASGTGALPGTPGCP